MAGDSTSLIQKCISEGFKKAKNTQEWVTIKIDCDCPITSLHIPDHSKVAIFSEKKLRLIHIGKKKEPMFLIGERALLKLQNLEIDYKGKETFMFKGRKRNPPNVFTENVEINRIRGLYTQSNENLQTIEAVLPEQLLKFMHKYIEAYREEANQLTGEPPLGSGYPSSLLNRVYLDSRQIRAYLLKDAVVIADVVEPTVSSEGFEPDKSMEILPAQLTERLTDGTQIDIVSIDHTLQNFILTATLGLFKFEESKVANRYGIHSGLGKFTIQNSSLRKERHVSQIDSYHYLDKAGWEPKTLGFMHFTIFAMT